MDATQRDATEHTEQPGAHAEQVAAARRRLAAENIIERIWQRDASVWKPEAAHAKSIGNALGWLTAVEFVREHQGEVEAFASEIRAAGFRHCLLLGMGGSSLCPEVLRRTFGDATDGIELIIVDTTDPDAIAAFTGRVDLARTLFIVASKSGSTIEPLSLFKYFYNLVRERVADDERAGAQFVAITDPAAPMEAEARERKFRQVFLNPPDIGGRYSALSLFGIVPAALIGLDIEKFLTRAERAIAACRLAAAENPAARLGCALGALALAGRNKLTLVTDDKLASLGLWIEQLVAESTGKEGKGIVPVAGEPPGGADVYGDDRVFVVVNVDELTNEQEARLAALEAAGHPIVRRRLTDLYDLGGEFFVWEFATAVAGWLLEINPFDQPNVQAAKTLMGEMLDAFKREGALPEMNLIIKDGELSLYESLQAQTFEENAEVVFLANPPREFQSVSPTETILAGNIIRHFKSARPGDYIALLAYLQETPEHDELLTSIRVTLRDALRVATTSGYGPRYLHSTGQLHKGAPAEGVFLIITDDARTDLPVPGEPYTFATLEAAQASGDLSALAEVTPRVLRLHLGANAGGGLRRLREIVAHVK